MRKGRKPTEADKWQTVWWPMSAGWSAERSAGGGEGGLLSLGKFPPFPTNPQLIIQMLWLFHHVKVACALTCFCRCLPHPLLLLDGRLWHPSVLPGGVHRAVPGGRGHVRRRPAGAHPQGRRLLSHDDGLLRERLLHHRCYLDPVLPLCNFYGSTKSSLEQLWKRK